MMTMPTSFVVSQNVSDPAARNHVSKAKTLMASEFQKWKEQNPTENDKDFRKGVFKPVTDCSNCDVIEVEQTMMTETR